MKVISFACPNCSRMLRYRRSDVGARFRCEECGHEGKILAPSVMDEQIDAAQEEVHTRRKQRKSWKKLRLGFLLMICGWWPITVILVGWCCFLVVSFSSQLGGGVPPPSPTLIAVLAILGVLAECATITGYCFCFFAPRKTNVQWWLIAPLAFAGLRTITCLGSIIALFQVALDAGIIWLLIAFVLFVGQWISALLFLRAVAYVLYSHGMIETIWKQVFMLGGVAVGWLVLFWIVYRFSRHMERGGGIGLGDVMWIKVVLAVAGSALSVAFGYIVVRYLIILHQMHTLTDR
jgi:hypothetical protein